MAMKTFHLRVYVGPTLVPDMACKFRVAGLAVTCEGTAHIHVMVDTESDPRDTFLKALTDKHGTRFCLTHRDVEVIRETLYATSKSFKF
jgi:hypothetical protein